MKTRISSPLNISLIQYNIKQTFYPQTHTNPNDLLNFSVHLIKTAYCKYLFSRFYNIHHVLSLYYSIKKQICPLYYYNVVHPQKRFISQNGVAEHTGLAVTSKTGNTGNFF